MDIFRCPTLVKMQVEYFWDDHIWMHGRMDVWTRGGMERIKGITCKIQNVCEICIIYKNFIW